MVIDRIAVTEIHTHRFTAAAARPGALPLPVAGCPGWTVADLVRHLGEVQIWWRAALLAGGAAPDEQSVRPLRAPGSDLLGWFRERSAAFLATLRATPPAAPVWCWWNDRRQDTAAAAAWRQAHEAVVHRWDAEAALGTPTPIDPAVAADGIDEFAARMLPSIGWDGPSGVLELRAVDSDRVWTFTPGRAAEPWPRPVSATVTGPAESLYLMLWRRLPLGRVVGDRRLAAAFLDWAQL
jgi:uncharacterized protein (TIGR03083 family)